MPETARIKVHDYNLTGDYLLLGERGVQEGRVSLYSDGKIIGTVKDRNGSYFNGSAEYPHLLTPDGIFARAITPDHGKFTRYLFGFIPENSRLLFLKLSSIEMERASVAWVMDAKSKSGNGLVYSGSYGFILSEELRQIQRTLPDDFSIGCKNLEDISRDFFETIFNDKIIELIMHYGQKNQQMGSLVLEKCD